MSKIRNIIFDFGGVIIDLHMDRTFQAIAELSGKSVEEIQGEYQSLEFLYSYEMGNMGDDSFRDALKRYMGKEYTYTEIDAAWNAMLGKIPHHRIDRIRELAASYNLYLLSNTNAIHEYAFTETLQKQHGLTKLDDLFKKAYYSHRLHLRKPHREIFDFLVKDSKINPEESIFLDDTPENLLGAEAAGLQTMHIPNPDFWLDKVHEL